MSSHTSAPCCSLDALSLHLPLLPSSLVAFRSQQPVTRAGKHTGSVTNPQTKPEPKHITQPNGQSSKPPFLKNMWQTSNHLIN